MTCHQKDKNEMLAFYDFPAPPWQHIRTSNPIESTSATDTSEDGQNKKLRCQAYDLSHGRQARTECPQKKWRRLRGFKLLAERIRGVQFKDGERIAPLQEVSLATLHLAKEKANKLSSLPQAETNRKTAFSQVSLSPLYFGPVDIPG